jgi:hypothetical protein
MDIQEHCSMFGLWKKKGLPRDKIKQVQK